MKKRRKFILKRTNPFYRKFAGKLNGDRDYIQPLAHRNGKEEVCRCSKGRAQCDFND
ncbi:MAG: hypothetical protein IT223_03835 [Crocinitomicaceae bacterium]|nr:hypothetical protein [Crocinitomicaceae bacterium]